eukprot:m51a1_g5482 hypothetical protein (395) ;mRNA; f:311850-313386
MASKRKAAAVVAQQDEARASDGMFDDEGLQTRSSVDQQSTELVVSRCFAACADEAPDLWVGDHSQYLFASIEGLSAGYCTLDASQPWLLYWSLNAVDLLGLPITPELAANAVKTLAACQSPTGGFGGGPGQLAHLAATYAAVRALMVVGTRDAYECIDRAALYRWLLSLKRADGSFMTHADGESDVRASYCALSCAVVANVLTPELARGAENWLARCQTFEGGFGGCPGNEAHGGYAFCALAALAILGRTSAIDLKSFTRWLVGRQMTYEGGFQGRAGKLVDACYSFWQGASFAILGREGVKLPSGELLLDANKLSHYVLACCQDERGGLRDKPGKSRDLYHTCYALSGLSIAQHAGQEVAKTQRTLKLLDAVHGVADEKLRAAMQFFSALPPV